MEVDFAMDYPNPLAGLMALPLRAGLVDGF